MTAPISPERRPTWRTVTASAADRLRAAGVDGPDAEVRWMVEQATGCEGQEYLAVLDRDVAELSARVLERMVARREAGEPLQYVLGRWGFRSVDLMVDRRVLIPRPETEVVAGEAMAELDRIDGRAVVDLGTGSGAIALAIAVERATAEVWATDASPDALDVARANLAGVGRPAARVHLHHGRWYEALPAEVAGRVDLVVSNPPYVARGEELPPSVAEWEPIDALVSGPTGLEAIGAVVAGAPAWLARPGALVVEMAPHQADAASALARDAGFTWVDVRPDLAGRLRALVARIH